MMLIKTTHAPRWARAAMLFIPAVWLGLIIGISFLEAPLKFTAPGITIPLGLGIGRRVFLAMNIVEAALGVFLLIALITLWRNHRYQELPNFNKMRFWSLVALVLLLIKTVVIRPLLAVHTDRVLAGTFEGGSSTHYYYIGVEVLLVIVLVALMIVAMRGLLPPTADVAGVVPHEKTAADE
ncbi:uncharacterized membrane protein (DUF485 family) [Enteractinococcus fodinae]|uniref:Uncharacterized membrane protein (DUF485 family) n=2 Tax=Enteractinococcus fodinae TaxID=684663 RepID=A0ABU2AYG2_9MICC|nr:uncharacterized membrane protein (DUF485 family) [Enteractinococcus fodinae]